MVGSSPTQLFSAYFGALVLEKAAILSFPQGLPGFENEHRFAAIQIPEQYPLLYLQSVATPELCLLTFPVQAIYPAFQLNIQAEDAEAIRLERESDAVTFAIITAEQGGVTTANLAAPLVVNLKNHLAVQALQADSSLSYRYPLPSAPPC